MTQTRQLGQTGLNIGPLGLAASYGAPAEAYEMAFERGCNYFYMGGGRKKAGMKAAVRHLIAKGNRDKMVIAIQTYARWGIMTPLLFQRTLSSLGIDYADILVLGWHNRAPSDRLIDFAQSMKARGLCRFIAMSGHNRSLFPILAQKKIFDVFHIRYNAAHRGAEKDCFPLFSPETRPGIISYTATRWGHLLDKKKMPPHESPLNAADCYRFAMANPHVDVCLCGPKNINEIKTALTALEKGPLSEEEIRRICRIGNYVKKNHSVFFA